MELWPFLWTETALFTCKIADATLERVVVAAAVWQ